LGEQEFYQLTEIHLLEHLNPVLDVPSVEGVLEPRGEVATVLCNLGHSCELLLVTSGKVQERQFIKVSLFLISHLNYLMVAMSQGLSSKPAPQVRTVQLSSHFDGNVKVAAFQGKLESSLGILHEL
jgi:hypothetical protein